MNSLCENSLLSGQYLSPALRLPTSDVIESLHREAWHVATVAIGHLRGQDIRGLVFVYWFVAKFTLDTAKNAKQLQCGWLY